MIIVLTAEQIPTNNNNVMATTVTMPKSINSHPRIREIIHAQHTYARTFGAEPGEHDRVRSPDASARQHDESQLQSIQAWTISQPTNQKSIELTAATPTSTNFL